MSPDSIDSFERCYEIVHSRDASFDGEFVTAVTSTGIYCRPSCSAVTPKRQNIRFLPTCAAAQMHGFRACLRCRPDDAVGPRSVTLGSDLSSRAMKLITSGTMIPSGGQDIIPQLDISADALNQLMVDRFGADTSSIISAHRARMARILIERSSLSFHDIARASGYVTSQKLSATMRQIYARTPAQLRGETSAAPDAADDYIELQLELPYRPPIQFDRLLHFFEQRAIPGVEEVEGGSYRRTLRLTHGHAIVELASRPDEKRPGISCRLRLQDVRDLASAISGCRRLLDLDADPMAVDECLASSELLQTIVGELPGLRIPGIVDAHEIAFRAVLGQQITIHRARTLTCQLVDHFGDQVGIDDDSLTRLFPTAEQLAVADLSVLGMPGSRRRAISAIARSLADGELVLDHAADRDQAEQALLAVVGIGPWTASYVLMRGLADPDQFLPTDAGVRAALDRLGSPSDPKSTAAAAEHWKPWRSYALLHLWSTLSVAAS